jgi:hypothetical protein
MVGHHRGHGAGQRRGPRRNVTRENCGRRSCRNLGKGTPGGILERVVKIQPFDGGTLTKSSLFIYCM